MNMICSDSCLYHGGTVEVREPLTNVGRADLDFGPGFYLTNDHSQAISWAKTKASRKRYAKAIVNIYAFDTDRFLAEGLYKIKLFPEYNMEWLDFIAASRKQQKPWLGFDWIEGGIANDRVIATVDAYTDGYMTAEMAIDKLINENIRHQVCILNQEIIDKYLTFVKSEEII